jgi:hypothetical protein
MVMKTLKKIFAVVLLAGLAATVSACCGFGGCGSVQPDQESEAPDRP